MRDCTRLSALRVLFNGLSIEQYNILVVDYYYGVSWCSSVPHEGFTGFQGTVNWSPIGSREACTGSQGAVQWYLSAVQWSLSGTIHGLKVFSSST